jgi:glycosyltransferase involved in cell wall biosynthesis
MRIAMISTPFVSVPPTRYGGTELIVGELCAGLVASGHEVTLFATGDSRPPPGVTLRARFARACWPPEPYVELDHAAWSVEQILADDACDIVHSHVPAALPFAPLLAAPLVHTVHHAAGPELARLAPLYMRSRAHHVTISHRQRELIPLLSRAQVIHHGLDPGRHRLGRGDGGYCAFVGRFARDKGVHVAIDVARRAGVPIRLGGKPHWCDGEYFEEQLADRLQLPGVTCLGEIDAACKLGLLARAQALLFPIDWEEPFGLVMIEAMLVGTPVLAFARGSVPEVVDHGVTGFICRDSDEMVARLGHIRGFDRARCRQRALARWTTARMVRDHLRLYQSLRPMVQQLVGDVRSAKIGA